MQEEHLKKTGYPDKTVYLHRLILNAPKNKEIDHINGNKLDNRKQNLRLCNRSENRGNSNGKQLSSSKFRGVYWCKRDKRWITIVNRVYGGRFKNEQEAGIKANELILRIYKKFAKLNIIE